MSFIIIKTTSNPHSADKIWASQIKYIYLVYFREIKRIIIISYSLDSIIPIHLREKISAGKIVKAIIINGLGFLSKPLYLFPHFFDDKPVAKLLGNGIKSQLEYKENEEEIELGKVKAGKFILATNILEKEELSSSKMLKAYKNQQGCERGFRFIKDPLFLASHVYVKNSKRSSNK